jgi:hypothetical protein
MNPTPRRSIEFAPTLPACKALLWRLTDRRMLSGPELSHGQGRGYGSSKVRDSGGVRGQPGRARGFTTS